MGPVAHNGNLGDICKICHSGSEESGTPLITPCLCSGSIKYVHQECLITWMKSSTSKICELCKYKITTKKNLKPIKKWEGGIRVGPECRNLLCKSCAFGVVTFFSSIILIIWSERFPADPLLVTLGAMFLIMFGMAMLMLVCSMCSSIIEIGKKWRAHNSVLVVQEVLQV